MATAVCVGNDQLHCEVRTIGHEQLQAQVWLRETHGRRVPASAQAARARVARTALAWELHLAPLPETVIDVALDGFLVHLGHLAARHSPVRQRISTLRAGRRARAGRYGVSMG